MTDVVLIVLLTLHIAGAITWLGGSLLFAFVVSPALKKTDSSSTADFLGHALSRFRRQITASSTATLVAGVLLFGYVTSSSHASSLMPTGWRLFSLILGGVLGLVAFIVALGVLLPTTGRILQALEHSGRVGADSPSRGSKVGDAMNLGNAIGSSSKAVSVLLLAVLVLMVLGVTL